MNWTLVTGGAKRLGAEICRSLAEKGYNIVIHYNHSQKEAFELIEECQNKKGKVVALQGDFSSLASTLDFVNKYLVRFPDTQNLINNVGNYLIKSASTTDYEDWYKIIQNNLNVPFIITRALLESLKKTNGSIVNIGVAGLSNLRADKYSTSYNCAKTALWVLTKSLALELAPFDVRANMVSPGYLNISEDLPEDVSRLPMKRAATCSEVVEVISFLLDNKNKYITGQNIEVAGGIRL